MLDSLNKQIIEAMKQKDAQRLSTLRLFSAALKNRELELKPEGKELSDEDILKVFKKQLKNRRQNTEGFNKGNRPDLAAKEEAELEILLSISDMIPGYVADQ